MKQPIPYVPRYRLQPKRILDAPSAWKGIESVLHCLISDFRVETKVAVEFGVEHGYSAVALSNYFDLVIGVDTFRGLGHDEGFCEEVQRSTADIDNLILVQMTWQEFTQTDTTRIDLIHVDVDHNYEDTYAAGEWAVNHAPVVLFHDTLSYPDVMQACGELAAKYGMTFYNLEESHGLGILSRRTL